MDATLAQPRDNSALVALIGVVAALLVIGTLTDNLARFGMSDRLAFFVVFALGFAMCGLGKLGMGAVYGWWNPLHLFGYAMGAVALLLAGAVFFNVHLPFISSERSALIALVALILVKMGAAQLYRI